MYFFTFSFNIDSLDYGKIIKIRHREMQDKKQRIWLVLKSSVVCDQCSKSLLNEALYTEFT